MPKKVEEKKPILRKLLLNPKNRLRKKFPKQRNILKQ